MDKVCILIKILAESHMTFNLGDKIDIRHNQTDHSDFCYQQCQGRPACLCRMSMLSSKLKAE